MSEEAEYDKSLKKALRKRIPDELIEIKHTGLPTEGESDLQAQLEAERKKNDEYSLIIEAEAMKNIITERDNLLKRIPSERREQVESFIGKDDPDPSRMEQVKASLILQGQNFGDDEDDDTPAPKTVSGRAVMLDSSLPQNQGGQVRSPTYDNPTIQQFSDLYAILRSPTSSAEQKAEVEQVLDETFAEIRKGLKSRPRNDPYRLPSGIVNHCYKCGMVSEIDLSKNACPHCGYDFSKEPMPRNPKFEPR